MILLAVDEIIKMHGLLCKKQAAASASGKLVYEDILHWVRKHG